MNSITYVIYGGLFFIVILLVVMLVMTAAIKKKGQNESTQQISIVRDEYMRLFAETEKDMREMKQDITNEIKSSRVEMSQNIKMSMGTLGDLLAGGQKASYENQDKRLAELKMQLSNMNMENEQKLENIRKTMESRIAALTEDNNKQLEQMRMTVDEKLQKTLEDRISKSFNLVSERLEQVYKGLGEMQTLASGVGDLKKVLSNVKTRGILGEIQLAAILEQILTPDQYDENVATKKGSTERVEFAVRLPGDDEGGIVYLPIDAKFPADSYSKLLDAYDTGDREAVRAAE